MEPNYKIQKTLAHAISNNWKTKSGENPRKLNIKTNEDNKMKKKPSLWSIKKERERKERRNIV